MSVSNDISEDPADINRLVEPQPHEFTANFNYAACVNHSALTGESHGLDAWFALDYFVKQHDGAFETTMQALGETWDVSLYYQDSAIQPPRSGITPHGTRIEHTSIREFRLHCEAHDDTGEKKANFHIRPRWQGMRVDPDDGDCHQLSIPKTLVEDTDAINVRVSGANIRFDNYNELLCHATNAVGVNGEYFRTCYRHETSNIQDAAYYVRLDKAVSGAIHARTGPLVSLAHVMQNDRSGYRKLIQNDSTERNEPLAGFYHTATLGPSRVEAVMPNHELPVECKHYYAREAGSKPDSDPLAHPKLEIAYQQSRWNESLDATTEALSQLDTELTQWLYSILNDADLDLRAGGKTYVPDAYFDAVNHSTTAGVVDLDITEVRHEQESVVYKHLADGMAPTDRDCLQTLVSDGGNISPSDLADETGRHQDTIYDSLQRLGDLVEHTYDKVSLKSQYISELVSDALTQAKDSLSTAGKAVHSENRGLDQTTSAFVAWQEKYGVNYDNTEEGLHFELGDVEDPDEIKRRLREGYELWCETNRDPVAFRRGTYVAQVEHQVGIRRVEMQEYRGTVMQMLNSRGAAKQRVLR